MNIIEFVRESNKIEGILRPPLQREIDAHIMFINLIIPTTESLEAFVGDIAPGHRLRDEAGLNVRVGNHIAPFGGPEIRSILNSIMARVTETNPWDLHVEYETLHPFTDGNGRSGRALWLWRMQTAPIGFLHQFYYQTLERARLK